MFVIYITTFSSDIYGEGYFIEMLFASESDAETYILTEKDDWGNPILDMDYDIQNWEIWKK